MQNNNNMLPGCRQKSLSEIDGTATVNSFYASKFFNSKYHR